MRYRVDSPRIISETIDGEVVIINLSNGNYYSLRDIGAAIWHVLDQTGQSDEIATTLELSYDGDPGEMTASVERLVAELLREGLIVPGESTSPEPGIPFHSNGGPRIPFTTPLLERFEDMQDLILLDPVHEVDELTGWPQPDPELQPRGPER